MRNTTILFALFGVIIAGALLFTFYFLPRLDASSNNINLEMALPVERLDMRYIEKGITPFCENKSHGIVIETKERAQIMAPVDGTVESVEGNVVYLRSRDNVLIYFSPLTNIKVSVGDYMTLGNILGYVDGNMFEFGIDNSLDSRYECPFLYLDEKGKEVISNGLKEGIEVKSRACECSFVSY
ncbi:MAG TPA: M23 family metallopeptidase [Candidatus Dojkabacteria bacterium]|nr:M23 family metallopeptidase [Candidatus Dojkabacteria bacterium]HQI92760.1 M23 family metallopeptidase [Candidatus Dojkabacteria bacterium]